MSDMDEATPEQPPVEVPVDLISPEALVALIEEFILREGTDYGRNEVELATKQTQIRKQLAKGDVLVAFDPNSESVTLMNKRDWLKLTAAGSKK